MILHQYALRVLCKTLLALSVGILWYCSQRLIITAFVKFFQWLILSFLWSLILLVALSVKKAFLRMPFVFVFC